MSEHITVKTRVVTMLLLDLVANLKKMRMRNDNAIVKNVKQNSKRKCKK